MSTNIFKREKDKEIGGKNVAVATLEWSQFDDALAVGAWLQTINQQDILQSLRSLTPDLRDAINRLIASSITLADPEPHPLTVADVQTMPILTVAECIAVILEENLDFFFRTLPRLLAVQQRILSTGSALLSSSSAPATAATGSAATP